MGVHGSRSGLGHLLHGMLGEDKARWEFSAAAVLRLSAGTLFSPPIPAPPPPPLLSCL